MLSAIVLSEYAVLCEKFKIMTKRVCIIILIFIKIFIKIFTIIYDKLIMAPYCGVRRSYDEPRAVKKSEIIECELSKLK